MAAQRRWYKTNGGVQEGNRAAFLERLGFAWAIYRSGGGEGEVPAVGTEVAGASEEETRDTRRREEVLSAVAAVLDDPVLRERDVDSFRDGVLELARRAQEKGPGRAPDNRTDAGDLERRRKRTRAGP